MDMRIYYSVQNELSFLFSYPLFPTKNVPEALGLKGPYEAVSIESLGSDNSECGRVRRVKLWLACVKYNHHEKQMVEALCLRKITVRPSIRLDIKRYIHLASLQLAEDFMDLSSAFGVLIGLDYYYDFIDHVIVKGQEGEPMAMHSTLGWIICDTIPDKSATNSIKTLFAKVEDHLDDILNNFGIWMPSDTKCRIVFDGSALFRNDSLNRQLDPGPPLRNDFVQILMRFRRFRITLHENDRDVTLCLWRDLWSLEAPRIFRFKRVRFGLTCSPFLAMSVIRCHALNHLQEFPLGTNQELENIYVDDIVFYVDEIVDAKESVIQFVAIMIKGGFRLTKWVHNMVAVLAKLPSEDLIKKDTNLVSKSLDIVCDLANDELTYGSSPNVDVGSSGMKHLLICVIVRLNSRSLTHLSDNQNDPEMLTPYHF
ncbi:hypothetical protein T12_2830 [Trichinella patagoniensis]|uniref:Uncharacterized protein n=1 Tax=Trichinella patagoniensis TaxID=990121 RepID=A0A0V0Z424_9BILA|nr:hypothetical protein T12_2830 [Trichinella patagoniensis]